MEKVKFAKRLGVPVISARSTQEKMIKFVDSKDFKMQVKAKVQKAFNDAINASNSVDLRPMEENKNSSYKFFIEKGNNSLIVRSILKQRTQWNQSIDKAGFADGMNFIWAPWKKNHTVKEMRDLKEYEEG